MKSNFYECIRVEVFFKIDVLTNFAKFKGKWLCHGRVGAYVLKKLQACTFIKKRIQDRCFSMKFT